LGSFFRYARLQDWATETFMLTKGNVVVDREDLADDGATSFEDLLKQCKSEELEQAGAQEGFLQQ
jgi:hypothetical protein